MRSRGRGVVLPELFLGLLAIAAAFVLAAHIGSRTVTEARHLRDTVRVTGSARKPISANLVRWSLAVSAEQPTAAAAARRVRRDSEAVRTFLRRAGVPSASVSASVVTAEKIVIELPRRRRLTRYRVVQVLEIDTRRIDVVERAATQVGRLIERGIGVAPSPLAYLSTELTQARLDALDAATAEARRRAEILVKGLGGKLGAMRSSSLGVYQVTPRDSTDVSDYGINDTSTREKDVTAVVSATFAVKR
jgi:uncharacterized protein